MSNDPENVLLLKVDVKDSLGNPVPKAKIRIYCDEKYGSVTPSSLRTGKDGSAFVTFSPSGFVSGNTGDDIETLTITAKLDGSNIDSSVNIKLRKVPVIFVHGYQANGSIFSNMSDYLSSKGFICLSISYNSENGVIAGASELGSFIMQQKLYLLNSGFQVSRFDLVCHSMGGLVARYYTCCTDYIKNNTGIRKLIFISTPQKGSVWASIAKSYFNSQAILDLIPDSQLFTEIFPSLINKGLNSSIQTASIIGQYDEVVSFESASLEDWMIKTTVFNVGESNMNVKSILDGSIMESANHKAVLNNTKVFETILSMLENPLPYPIKRK